MAFYRQIVQVREELKSEIRYQREVSGRVQKHPDVTTKHGKLKSKRKNPPTTIYVDDLAALDSLSEVYTQCPQAINCLCFILFFRLTNYMLIYHLLCTSFRRE